jgi:CYTH domain-containing protein
VSFHNPDNSLKYARIEEERRFLLKSLPQDMLESDPFIRIIDRYIPETRLRLRRMKSPEGDTITLKLGQKYQPEDFDAQQTIMTNMYLNEAEYQVLRRLGGAQINKRRYPYVFEQQQYSIDVFDRDLAGLVLAEIESRPGVDIAILPFPGFALREVTGDPVFSGANLAGLNGGDLQKILSEYKIK